MKIKEHPSFGAQDLPVEAISPPARIELEVAKCAFKASSEFVGKRVKPQDHPALTTAVALAFYNLYLGESSEKHEKQLFKRLNSLVSYEEEASHPSNPLPTIGWEVESPRIPAMKERRKIQDNYSAFSPLIGLPLNRVNSTPYYFSSASGWYWEFSPYPAFAWQTQARILSELIQGGFIPHLTDSKQDADILKHLDGKMVSLHINLGFPKYIEANAKARIYKVHWYSLDKDPKGSFFSDLELFAGALAYAYTSPTRLRYRTSRESENIKETGVLTSKNNDAQRIELKALEVNSTKTYELLKIAQLTGACFFTYFSTHYPELGALWKEEKQELINSFRRHDIKTSLKDKIQTSQNAENIDFTSEVRWILNWYAREAQQSILKQYK